MTGKDIQKKYDLCDEKLKNFTNIDMRNLNICKEDKIVLSRRKYYLLNGDRLKAYQKTQEIHKKDPLQKTKLMPSIKTLNKLKKKQLMEYIDTYVENPKLFEKIEDSKQEILLKAFKLMEDEKIS